jgi:glutamate-1-semialdehyde 2,1-aminomutase/spore coat polysaccharide biosynthesis protein SpsF
MTTIAIVQARMTSTRLPGKVLADLGGKPLVAWTLERAARARTIDSVWLATSDQPTDDDLAQWAEAAGWPVFRGSESDVLGRYLGAAEASGADVVVRLTADCPFLAPDVIDDVVTLLATSGADYASNTTTRRFPDGLDAEAFTRAALDRAASEAREPFLREHVTPYINGVRRDRLPWGNFIVAALEASDPDFSHLRFTVDEPDDLAFARAVAGELGTEFDWMEVVALLTRKPDLLRINRGHAINEGSAKHLADTTGRRFERSNQQFARALETIPLASQTFSKSHQQWVRGATPLFMERARGARVWDVDGNPYIDYVLGLLPIVLGYCDPDVDAAIRTQLDKGIVFPLASTLEAELAERLVRLIPSAEMVRFGKNGSDATTAAVRLARAHTGRDRVLLAGYHGWHDWYIGTTTRDLGVPAAVKALSGTFPFNDADALERALNADPDGIAAVVLEPSGATPPAPGFLERIRELTERHGVILVFDEIVTGFRVGMGGAQERYGVTPDLSAFGKAMGNGMPISAVVGRAEIMRGMEDIFFSGTFGGECLSLAASIATIDKLERENVPARLAALGQRLMAMFNSAAAQAGLGDVVAVAGEGWWPRIVWKSAPVEQRLLISLFRQEVVAHGLFMGASFNLCLAHDDGVVERETATSLAGVFSRLRDHLDAPDPLTRLRGEMFQPTFSVR